MEIVFKNRINYWVKEKGFIQKRIAKKMSVSEPTFISWSKNVTQPDLKQAYVLSRIMGISLEDLCECIDDEVKEKKE